MEGKSGDGRERVKKEESRGLTGEGRKKGEERMEQEEQDLRYVEMILRLCIVGLWLVRGSRGVMGGL